MDTHINTRQPPPKKASDIWVIEKPDSSKVHIVERVVKISELFGIKIKYDNINIIYKPASESIEIADNFIKDNFPTKHYLLGINISAGSEARFWGIERFRKLLNVLSNYKNLDIVVLRSPKDENLAEKITNGKFIIFLFRLRRSIYVFFYLNLPQDQHQDQGSGVL